MCRPFSPAGSIKGGRQNGRHIGLINGELYGGNRGIGADDRTLELLAESDAILGPAAGGSVLSPGVPGGLGDADLDGAFDLGIGIACIERAVVVAGARRLAVEGGAERIDEGEELGIIGLAGERIGVFTGADGLVAVGIKALEEQVPVID